MADFETGAELAVSVSSSSLSDARDTIESELGDIEVGVSAVVEGNNRGSMQPRDPSSGQFMAIEGVEQRVVNTNEVLDGIVQIESERWELDKVRNDHLEELLDRGVMPGGGRQGGGGGGSVAGLGGLTKLLGGIGLSGGATALAGGGVLAGAFGANEAVGERSTGETVARGAAQSLGNPASFAAAMGSELGTSISVGLSDEAQSTLGGFGDNVSLPDLSEQSWPELPNLRDESWPELPDLGQNVEWPDPPEFDFNPFDGGQQGNPNSTRSTGGPTRRGPNDQIQSVEPTVNVGGVDVEVPIDLPNVGNTVDDLQSDMESLDQDLNNLERRVAEAIEGFF